jgi:methionine synthase II (cobalamin-independent)
VQYSEGLPGAVLDEAGRRIFFRKDQGFDRALERFYQAIIDENTDAFAISREVALGLHVFLDRLARPGAAPAAVKGQVTGPFSFAMTVTDDSKRALAYSPEFHEIATQGMAMKARWMARRLREGGRAALVVLDEPYLCAFGSAFVNVSREEVAAAIDAAVSGIHAEGALAGIHCCGNTDWSLVFSTAVDVVNFDAYSFFQGIPLYPEPLRAFLDRGGALSWGIVPTSADELPDAESLVRLLDQHLEQLAAKGLDATRVLRQSMLTPSCGMGSYSVDSADRVVDVLLEVSERVQRRAGL